MKTPCEIVNKRYLPSIRAMIAKELAEKHNCTQMKIAKWLGVTQAAISQYLSSKRAGTERILKTRPEIKEFVQEITLKLANGEKEKFNIGEEICNICKSLKLKEEAYTTIKSYATA